ncbi:hypothetical protein GcC1_011006 [Golovinomyces cichoracearum]|uniref:Uncharacterized protein n=1 Tax=Golovinomyces cichoracearum TaxID=62708 RepID=A0A420J7H0_9PEZI|nr:hypothetical protein GcC1_011006 [Golovinomyces cichoracearum]
MKTKAIVISYDEDNSCCPFGLPPRGLSLFSRNLLYKRLKPSVHSRELLYRFRKTASNSTASVSSHAFANSTKNRISSPSLLQQAYGLPKKRRERWDHRLAGIPVEHTELASSLETFETMATPPRAPVGLPPSPLRVSGSDHGDSVTGLYCEVCTGLRTGKHREVEATLQALHPTKVRGRKPVKKLTKGNRQ